MRRSFTSAWSPAAASFSSSIACLLSLIARAVSRVVSDRSAMVSEICRAPWDWVSIPCRTVSNFGASACTRSVIRLVFRAASLTEAAALRTRSENCSMVATPPSTAPRISSTVFSMSIVASAVWSARRRISRATTLKP